MPTRRRTAVRRGARLLAVALIGAIAAELAFGGGTEAEPPGETPATPGIAAAGLGTPVALDGLAVVVTADGDQAGPRALTVTLRDAAGWPVVGATVTVTAEHVGMDMGRFPEEAVATGPGRYVAERVAMGMGGAWRAEVVVARPGRAPVVAHIGIELEGLS